MSAIYFGTKEEGNAAIKAFLDQGPKSSNISEVPYNNLVYTANFGGDIYARQKGVTADLWGYQLENLTVSTLTSTYNKLVDFLLADPNIGSSSWWTLEKFGLGASASISDDATSFPWRKTSSFGYFEFNLPNNPGQGIVSTADTFAKKLRSDLNSGCGNPQGNVFVNYARGDERPEQIYGQTNLPRLRLLKEKYDPKGLFNHYNSFA